MATEQGLDYILKTAIDKAIVDTERRTGYRISIEQAVAIIKSQAKGIYKAMEDKDIAKIDALGKFLIKPGREELIHASRQAAEEDMPIEQRRLVFKAIGEQIRAKRDGDI